MLGLLKWCGGKESTCQCRQCKRCDLDPWVGKINWKRKWQPAPGFLLEKFMDKRGWWAKKFMGLQRVRRD